MKPIITKMNAEMNAQWNAALQKSAKLRMNWH
jgi:hypothetical protein